MLTTPPLVLLAEESEIDRTVARALMAQHDVRCDVARDGLEAARMIGEREYAAVLMNCQMPALDGYAATACIRAAEHGGRVPIIAMTARALPGTRERCIAAGMDDCLCKPLRADELAAVVDRWILRRAPAASTTAPERRVA